MIEGDLPLTTSPPKPGQPAISSSRCPKPLLLSMKYIRVGSQRYQADFRQGLGDGGRNQRQGPDDRKLFGIGLRARARHRLRQAFDAAFDLDALDRFQSLCRPGWWRRSGVLLQVAGVARFGEERNTRSRPNQA
jgi:hypothetical protein